MRMLLLLRGLPASGKSTFIEQNNLQDYTISSDMFRTLLGSNELEVDGKFRISMSVSQARWSVLYEVLEKRFSIGAFTVLDATNIKGADIQKAYKLARSYRYRVYCVDFTDVSAEECIKRDANRPEHKQVGRKVIERMNQSLQNNKVPAGIKVIKPSEWLTETRYRTEDVSQYKKIHHIGDIHGCYTALKNYLTEGLNDDELYIFIGDYIDRGIENVDCIKFMASICEKPNVVLLEGNHEKYLKAYINDEDVKANDFQNITRVEFDNYGKSEMKSYCKKVYNKLRQCYIYKWNGKIVLCTHGGLSRLPGNLSLINSYQMINGVGFYKDMLEVNKSFAEQNLDKEVYQVHGHRNVEQVPIQVNNRCFNVCEHIEYGGNLRTLVLDETGFHSIYTKNPVYRKKDELKIETVGEMLDIMQMNDNIKVVSQPDTNISSYNFTRKAFQNGIWDDITTKARGLFINDKTCEIVARGYDKFFNINERPETNADVLPNTLSYPVKAYKKENGFLGLLGFDNESDTLLFCSKSEIGGKYATYFKDILLSKISEDVLYNYMKPHNVTLVFEVIDIVNDPHIIKYNENKVILLDIIENSVDFKKYSYDKVKETAELLGLDCKEECFTIQDSEGLKLLFKEISKDDYKWKNHFIEGFVFEDSNLFMFKYKCEYYKYWKVLRGQVESISSGGKPKIKHPFLKWVSEDKSRYGKDIISLRSEYQKTHK